MTDKSAYGVLHSDIRNEVIACEVIACDVMGRGQVNEKENCVVGSPAIELSFASPRVNG